jgi:hypothetical protein
MGISPLQKLPLNPEGHAYIIPTVEGTVEFGQTNRKLLLEETCSDHCCAGPAG